MLNDFCRDCRYGRCAWCPGRESNPYALRHKILSLVCLPFHHPGACIIYPEREIKSSAAGIFDVIYPSNRYETRLLHESRLRLLRDIVTVRVFQAGPMTDGRRFSASSGEKKPLLF